MSGGADPLLVGIDIGTQSVRALLADQRGRTIALAARPTPVRALGDGRAEYDADMLWRSVISALTELAQVVPSGSTVAGIAAASMGESCFLLDETGAELAPAIAWFDRRTEDVAARLAVDPGEDRVYGVTGQHVDSTYTLCKLLWQREADPALFARARKVLNIADWVAFRLCGEPATDLSLASRTLCLDLAGRTWSSDLLAAVALDRAMLPELKPSGAALGRVRPAVLEATGLPGRPIVAVGGHDHVVGGFAAGSMVPGTLLDSMGTAEALFYSLGHLPDSAALRAAGFAQGVMSDGTAMAYLGAGLNASGGAVEWLRGLLAGAPSRAALQAEAEAPPPGSGGVCFVPHLAYSSAPQADTRARGAFLGLTLGASRGALMRSVLEGLAMEARLVVDGMAALPAVGVPSRVHVIGGSTQNALFVRIKAAVMNRPLHVVAQPEATCFGAVLLAGIAAGLWPNLAAAHAQIEQDWREVPPEPAWLQHYQTLYERVHRGLYSALRPANHALSRLAALPAA